MSKVIRQGVRQVKPILSLDRADARRRVLNLYKAWYRQIPYIGMGIFGIHRHNPLTQLPNTDYGLVWPFAKKAWPFTANQNV